MWNEEIENKIVEYEKTFDEFPSFMFIGTSEVDLSKMLDDCLSEKKDVYDLGYLTLDDDTIY